MSVARIQSRRAKSRLSDAASLPVGPCTACEREVLGYLSGRDSERFACVHCDGPLQHVDWLEEADLEDFGYDSWDPLAGGCGTGCAPGGCGARR